MVLSELTSIANLIASQAFGTAPFESEIIEITDQDRAEVKLNNLLSKVKKAGQGHFAYVVFGLPKCKACQAYEESFKKQLEAAKGEHVFIKVSNYGLLDQYKIAFVPQVKAVDHEGNWYDVTSQMNSLLAFKPDASKIDTFTLLPTEDMQIAADPQTKVTRVGLIHNSSAHWGDWTGLSELDMGITKDLVNKWLEGGYSKIYLLMDANNLWPYDDRVVILRPTDRAMRLAVGAINASGMGAGDQVDTLVLGHGGGEGAKHFLSDGMAAVDFAAILNEIPNPVQRITRLVECHAASFLDMGIRDDNDLLIIYAGRKELAKEKSSEDVEEKEGNKEEAKDGEEKVSLTELNMTDARDLGILYANDIDGDGIIANWEMFWQGMAWSYENILPFSRGFVYDAGPDFVDMGFGSVPAELPFPKDVTVIDTIADYVEALGNGYPKGITVVCYNLHPSTMPEMQERLSALAGEYNGYVQFLLLQPNVAGDAAGYDNLSVANNITPVFRLSFYAAREMKFEGHVFDFDGMKRALHNILNGQNMEDELYPR
ncbi:MAG: hypothetical protein HYT75_06470 [Deltaproteobacteria bacterium]|nr:hypothetical protein [Deltaproteobacteria bacterium]